MDTLVIKGSNFSYNDISKMKNRKDREDSPKSYKPDIQIVVVYPSGHTENFISSKKLFDIINEDEKESVIYYTKIN